ncbi:hypothetical protein HDU98_000682 [Podochytrium sp. JEL0797]|nr:hypothetical protein HDU98_000682 [Podochytrium sp. JEL0797]
MKFSNVLLFATLALATPAPIHKALANLSTREACGAVTEAVSAVVESPVEKTVSQESAVTPVAGDHVKRGGAMLSNNGFVMMNPGRRDA